MGNNENVEATFMSIIEQIKDWPKWKKESYNEMFAGSNHAAAIL